MDTAVFLVLLVVLWPSVQALFTVEMTSPFHLAEYLGDVTMECRFTPVGNEASLSVFWRRILPLPAVEVYRLKDGQEDPMFQDPHYRGRVKMSRDELRRGRAVLNVSGVRINDSGTYQCLVENRGADYKQTTLAVRASYESIKKRINITGTDKVELTCESQGYPLADIVWTDGKGENSTKPRVTHVTTPDHLIQVTSRVSVTTAHNNYTCAIADNGLVGHSVTFNIPEELPVKPGGRQLAVVLTVLSSACLFMAVSFLVYRNRKGFMGYSATETNNQPNGDKHTAARELNRRCVENLRAALKSRYKGCAGSAEGSFLTSFCEIELPERLCYRGGLPAPVSVLLRDAKEVVLLEGETGSGKTTLAQSLATAWAQSSDWDPFGVKQCHLFVLLSCETAKGDLFQEMLSQLGLTGELSAESLRTALTGPEGGLLVLDGYREGGQELDESLLRFLGDRQACGVLVTAAPGQCSSLGRSCRTVLKLHSRDPGDAKTQ